MSSQALTLSVVVITKNEAKNILECLGSVNWADEVIVVDAQSTDCTVELAKAHTTHVFVRPWPGFGPQKNFGFEQVSSDWILILDADERVSSELRKEIFEFLLRSSGVSVAFRLPRKNYFYGKWVRWGGAYPDYQIRLFQRGRGRYNDVAVHENLIIDGHVGTFLQPLEHHTERQICDHFRKFNLYTTLAAVEKSKSQKTVTWYHLTCNPFVIFLKTYIMKQGYRDGTRGVIFAVFASMYTFVKYTKLLESQIADKSKLIEDRY